MAVRISSKPKSILAVLFPLGFLSIFVVVGVGIFFGMYVLPTWRMAQAKSWTKTTAVVDKSEIQEHRGSDSTSYTPEVQYHYLADGKLFTNNRFWFRSDNENDHTTLEAVMRPYTVGAEVGCFFDPKEPSSSVLIRQTNLGWFPVIFPMVFIFGPMLMMVFFLMSYFQQPKSSKPSRQRATTVSSKVAPQRFAASTGDSRPMSQNDDDDDDKFVFESGYCPVEELDPHNDQPFVMKAGSTPMGAFLGIAFLALVWNGIVFGILALMLSDKTPELFPILFLSFFGLIGLGLIGGAFYSFLKLFNPRATLVCSNSLLYPGSEFELSWTFSRRSNAMHDLRIFLIGIESASYRQGTSTRTETNEFCRKELFHTSEADQIAEGFTLAKIPEDLMYTFTGSNNKVQWYTELVAEIRRWPDVRDRFEIKIYPPRLDGAVAEEASV